NCARLYNNKGGVMKRDLYAEVSARIVAELERGAAPWTKPCGRTRVQCARRKLRCPGVQLSHCCVPEHRAPSCAVSRSHLRVREDRARVRESQSLCGDRLSAEC